MFINFLHFFKTKHVLPKNEHYKEQAHQNKPINTCSAGNLCSLSNCPAMGFNSASTKSLQVFCSISCSSDSLCKLKHLACLGTSETIYKKPVEYHWLTWQVTSK